jgi:GNAT superfamily N-acetyltransferase
MSTRIVPATLADVPALADVLARSFDGYPMITWPLLIDDDAGERIRDMFLWLDMDMTGEGWTWRTQDGAGVMALIPPEGAARMVELDRVTGPRIGGLAPDGGARYSAFWDWVLAGFPDEPNWFIDHLGVDPARQGDGVGSSLLRFALGKASADRLPLFLETGRERNVDYYTRFGFEVFHDDDAPGGGPHVWFMRRDPGRRAARVVVVDRRQRVLLFGYRNPTTGKEVWATTGGGIEPGESPEEAARREFREETEHDAPAALGPDRLAPGREHRVGRGTPGAGRGVLLRSARRSDDQRLPTSPRSPRRA